jgi:hypothetical protein
MKDTLTIQSQCQETIKNQVDFSWLSVLAVMVFIWFCISAIIGLFAGLWILIF